MAKTLLYIGVGGALGAIARYLMSSWIVSLSGGSAFPFGTFTVNILGAFLLGILSQVATQSPGFGPDLRALVMIGLLGAFTTFSTFSSESFALLEANRMGLMAINIFGSVGLGLIAVWAGRAITNVLIR